jgi:hypothetical protein
MLLAIRRILPGAGADGFGRKCRLPYNCFRQSGDGSDVPLDILEVGGLTYEVKRAQRFPDVILIGADIRETLAGSHTVALAMRKVAHLTGNG